MALQAEKSKIKYIYQSRVHRMKIEYQPTLPEAIEILVHIFDIYALDSCENVLCVSSIGIDLSSSSGNADIVMAWLFHGPLPDATANGNRY